MGQDLIVVSIVAFLGALLATPVVLAILRRTRIFDHPNHRSSHSVPTPRGGGWGLLCGFAAGLVALAWFRGTALPFPWPMLAGALLLLVVSATDDVRGLGAAFRFGAQIVAIALALAGLPGDALLFQGWLPLPLDRLATAVAWLWFVNLYNFMDGIDGLAATEAVAIGAGIGAAALLAGAAFDSVAAPGWLLAAAAMGFLPWNWQRARIFLGDVGSILLGFLGGWLLIALAIEGQAAAALILPAYFLADATVTLLRRLMQGAHPAEPHREHFYQRAIRAGWSHARTTLFVACVNAGLFLLALLSVDHPWPAIAGAALLTGGALAFLDHAWRRRRG